jgi:hypothetical protein
MRRIKALHGVMSCVLLVGCGALLDTGTRESLNAAYTLITVDGESINPWAEGDPSSGAPLSHIDFTPGPYFQVGFLFNPGRAGDIFLGWSGLYTLDRATSTVALSWVASIVDDPHPPGTVDAAMAVVGNVALLEGDWLYFDIGLVHDEESILYPFSQTRLGYLEQSAACAQAEPDFALVLFC